jgi:hypothetical protein
VLSVPATIASPVVAMVDDDVEAAVAAGPVPKTGEAEPPREIFRHLGFLHANENGPDHLSRVKAGAVPHLAVHARKNDLIPWTGKPQASRIRCGLSNRQKFPVDYCENPGN